MRVIHRSRNQTAVEKPLGTVATAADTAIASNNTAKNYREGDIIIYRHVTGEHRYARVAPEAGINPDMKGYAIQAQIRPDKDSVRDIMVADIVGKL